MRNEQEVFAQLLQFAGEDENIRCVVINGSRMNPNAPKDFMQDYDVDFYLANLQEHPYNSDRSWIDRFGERVVVQYEYFEDGMSIFMMQFKDSVRIDLSFKDLNQVREVYEDSLCKVLLDKDGLNLGLPEPSDRSYLIKRPARELWDLHVIELWWLQVYIAKELWRDEMPRVKELYDRYFMESLRFLVEWHIGIQHDWSINTGATGKWFKRFLEPELYQEYISLYVGADPDEQWNKLFEAGDFIRKIAVPLADRLGYDYPAHEEREVTAYIQKVRVLPPEADAKSWDE
ncbi:aminoglycoside 6-adenylyltransferase [Paenibacillus pinihumi]|uniref:aminoglycoside 6-adenylyltransferase n=1 Tax=Paenibacillus pinihumi TaxID=669462 RepID=UPI000420A017|nr:aminoglycoside 6-adenylyltransferase [Paenibacillus pinihumi]